MGAFLVKAFKIILAIVAFLLMLPLADAVYNFFCRTTRHYATEIELNGDGD